MQRGFSVLTKTETGQKVVSIISCTFALMANIKQRTALIKSKAHELGFLYCGVSKARRLDNEARQLEGWLKSGAHADMSWMENHFEKRVDPTLLVPGAKSVISLMFNYYNPDKQRDPDAPKISKYAYGRDYHKVIKKRLKRLYRFIEDEIGEVNGRFFVDSAPVLDKAWAKHSGLGWQGKNTLIISKKSGSFFFLAEVILDLELEYDGSIKDYCGSCERCLQACPTGALSPERPYYLDAQKCISYYTIELKGSFPDDVAQNFENWMFGCDICQDVCPWNRLSKKHHVLDFEPSEKLLNMSKREWLDITHEVFEDVFKGSPVKRTGFEGLKRNIEHIIS